MVMAGLGLPRTPNLFDVELELEDQQKGILDHVSSYFECAKSIRRTGWFLKQSTILSKAGIRSRVLARWAIDSANR